MNCFYAPVRVRLEAEDPVVAVAEQVLALPDLLAAASQLLAASVPAPANQSALENRVCQLAAEASDDTPSAFAAFCELVAY